VDEDRGLRATRNSQLTDHDVDPLLHLEAPVRLQQLRLAHFQVVLHLHQLLRQLANLVAQLLLPPIRLLRLLIAQISPVHREVLFELQRLQPLLDGVHGSVTARVVARMFLSNQSNRSRSFRRAHRSTESPRLVGLVTRDGTQENFIDR